MGLLSSSVSITRYTVEGKLEEPVLETVFQGLKKNAITEIDDEDAEKTVGWTSFDHPFRPDFEGSSFVMGTHLVFSLRIDKKSIPTKIVNKHYNLAMAKQLAESGREYLSRSEKSSIKDNVIQALSLRIPSTPNIYDVIWNYEEAALWFFSNLKSANEELETHFTKSFKLNLIRLFPYTMADLKAGLADPQRDMLAQLAPTHFKE